MSTLRLLAGALLFITIAGAEVTQERQSQESRRDDPSLKEFRPGIDVPRSIQSTPRQAESNSNDELATMPAEPFLRAFNAPALNQNPSNKVDSTFSLHSQGDYEATLRALQELDRLSPEEFRRKFRMTADATLRPEGEQALFTVVGENEKGARNPAQDHLAAKEFVQQFEGGGGLIVYA